MKSVIFMLSFLFLAISTNAEVSSVTYNLTVTNTWTPANFGSLPPGAHLSPLVAFTHVNRFTKFQLYDYASIGVKKVCEVGDAGRLNFELKKAQMDGLVGDIYIADGGADPGESFTTDFTVDDNFRYISFISMLAPSSDWVVAVARMDMKKRNGRFRGAAPRTRNIKAYDCGTADAIGTPSDPRLNIGPLTEAPFDTKYPASYTLQRALLA